jgi:hypothetical protein
MDEAKLALAVPPVSTRKRGAILRMDAPLQTIRLEAAEPSKPPNLGESQPRG